MVERLKINQFYTAPTAIRAISTMVMILLKNMTVPVYVF